MELTIELTGKTERRYWECRRLLLTNPVEILQSFNPQWLRVVGAIELLDHLKGHTAYPVLWWLLTVNKSKNRDADNLKLAHEYDRDKEDYGCHWADVPFDPGYLVLDPELADRILHDGMKSHGISFLYDFEPDWIDRILREIVPWKLSADCQPIDW